MANPTTNYSFQMPTATDLVTDLPADFEVFGQAVDTRIKALNPNTTLGDLNYGSATANTNTRLPIGTTGQVLAVSGGVPAWTTAAAPADSWTLLSTTALSGLSTVTVSSLTSSKLVVWLVNGRNSSGGADIRVRPNSSTTTSDYNQNISGTFSGSYFGTLAHIYASASDNTGNNSNFWLQIENCKSTTSMKPFEGNGSSASQAISINYMGAFMSTSAVTSINVTPSSGTWTNGTLYIYGA
jgi:hypothetical protein